MNKITVTMDDITALIEAGTGKRSMDAIRAEIGQFVAAEETLIVTRSEQAEAIATTTISLITIGALLSSVVASAFAWIIINNVQRQVGVNRQRWWMFHARLPTGI